jgi:hypothetical protein
MIVIYKFSPKSTNYLVQEGRVGKGGMYFFPSSRLYSKVTVKGNGYR